MGVSDESFTLANERGARQLTANPTAVEVYYDARAARLVIVLNNRTTISLLLHDIPGLQDAKPADLRNPQISPSGLGIHFPRLDADIYLPALLDQASVKPADRL